MRLALAALISAYRESEDQKDGLRALLPIAGRTLVEQQVRRAVAAGAGHAVILVERVPPALNAAVERLRRDKIAVEIAREPADAADRFHREEHILLIADGLLPTRRAIEAVAAQNGPALLAIADTPDNTRFERIDADWRWAGLALTDSATLAGTADMLGDWDIESTLMRRIAQSRPAYVRRSGEDEETSARAPIRLVDDRDQALAAGRDLLADFRPPATNWVRRFIHRPLAALIAPRLIDSGIEPRWPRAVSLFLAGSAVLLFWFGWRWAGLGCLLLSGPLSAVAAHIDLAQLRYPERHWEVRFARGAALGLSLAALAGDLYRTSGSAIHLYAAVSAILVLVLGLRERRNARHCDGGSARHEGWLVGAEPAIWISLPCALAGLWHYWAPLILVYTAFSIFIWQDRLEKHLVAVNAGRRAD